MFGRIWCVGTGLGLVELRFVWHWATRVGAASRLVVPVAYDVPVVREGLDLI